MTVEMVSHFCKEMQNSCISTIDDYVLWNAGTSTASWMAASPWTCWILDPVDCKAVACSAGAWDDAVGRLCVCWTIELKLTSNGCNRLVTSSVTCGISWSMAGKAKTSGWTAAVTTWGCRARKIFEFHLVRWASNSQLLLVRGTYPLAQVFKLINNS